LKPIINKYYSGNADPLLALRTIILFGNNVSTYKFALTSAILKQSSKSKIKYSELRDDFVKELYNHYIICPDQWVAGKNTLTEAFDEYKTDNNWEKLVKVAEKNIYNNVFDAFHNVGGSSIKQTDILFEKDNANKQLIITDNLNLILENNEFVKKLTDENQSRWNIVEEAWKNKLSPNLLEFVDGDFYSITSSAGERVNLRSAINILMPYQKDQCFYCNKIMNTSSSKDEDDFPDVDHFVPLSFISRIQLLGANANGVWNIVIACKECNRGGAGKFQAPADKQYFEKLLYRNLLFTEEHKHSLKNSVLISLGVKNAIELTSKMNLFYKATDIINGWKPKRIY
jgi:hypothetical protein